MPNSDTTPARSEGDDYHASYNDYLWELGQADSTRDAKPSPDQSRFEGTVPIERTPIEIDPSG